MTCQLNYLAEIVRLILRLMCCFISPYLTAFRAFVNDDVAALCIGHCGDRLHLTAAFRRTVAGVFVKMKRPQAKRAVIARCIAERLDFFTAVSADKAGVVFRKPFRFHMDTSVMCGKPKFAMQVMEENTASLERNLLKASRYFSKKAMCYLSLLECQISVYQNSEYSIDFSEQYKCAVKVKGIKMNTKNSTKVWALLTALALMSLYLTLAVGAADIKDNIRDAESAIAESADLFGTAADSGTGAVTSATGNVTSNNTNISGSTDKAASGMGTTADTTSSGNISTDDNGVIGSTAVSETTAAANAKTDGMAWGVIIAVIVVVVIIAVVIALIPKKKDK